MSLSNPLQITLQPSGHQFESDAQTTLLQAALDHGFMLPYGCRNGACGSCKGRVLSGEVDYGAARDGALSAAERAQGMALFCCAKPLTDVVIECREVGAARDIPIRTMPCRVESMQIVGQDDVMLLKLKLPANERLQFLPGQYIDILLKDGKRRSFSLASPPHQEGFIDLHIRRVPDGHFTGHVFGSMKVRDILRFEGPLGSFFLRDKPESNAVDGTERPALLVAGGTGMAPMASIIQHAIQVGSTRRMVLYFGARTRADLYLHQQILDWQKQLPALEYVPVLSDPAPQDEWTGRTGLVHHAAMQDIGNLSGWQAYVCGAPAMVDAAKKDFTQAANLPIEHFYADSFTYSAT